MRFWTVKFNPAANRREKRILKMYITYELLKEKGACSNGLNWFKQNFPEGCELNEETVARVKNAIPVLCGGFITISNRIKDYISFAA